ncbi:MAG: hypothetical protein JNL97_03655 [Verrucomicrobiales bacterium]|nr:hypothetical protein [Verrucomicrobiales bacterium]
MNRAWAWFSAAGLAVGACVGRSDTFLPDVSENAVARWEIRNDLGSPSPEVVLKLSRYAESPDIFVAGAAVRRLGEFGLDAEEAIPTLMDGLTRLTAAGGENRRANMPPSPPYAWALAHIGPDRWDVLKVLLEAAAGAKESFGWQHVRDWRNQSAHGTELLRRAALEARLPAKQRSVALSVLSMAYDAALVPQLSALAEHPEMRRAVEGYAMRANTAEPGVLSNLAEQAALIASRDIESGVRIFLWIGQTGAVGDRDLVRKLLRFAYDPSHPPNAGWSGDEPQPLSSMAHTTLRLLSRHGVADAVGPYLEDPDTRVRCGAAMVMWGSVAEGLWVGPLRKGLTSADGEERTVCATTLERVPAYREEARRVLLRSASESALTNQCRRLALRSLGFWVPSVDTESELWRTLEQCARDPDAVVRAEASRILHYERKRRAGETGG